MAAVQLELWTRPTPSRKATKTPKPKTSKLLQRRDIWAELTGAAQTSPAQTSPAQSVLPEDSPPQSGLGEEPAASKSTVLAGLRRQVSALETGGKHEHGPRLSCGVDALNGLLPGGGIAPATLVEWVEQDPASGAGWLSMLAAKAALDAQPDSNGRLVVIDTEATFYPLAASAAGLPLDRLLIIRPANLADGLWAADQALRNPAVSVVWGVLPVLDDRQARRLQLAAEIGQTLGLWLRPAKALAEPSWADVRWFVRGLQPADLMQPDLVQSALGSDPFRYMSFRYMEARLVRCRGGRTGTSVTLKVDSSGRVTHHVSNKRQTAAEPLVAQLADPTAAAEVARERTAKRRLA